MNILLFQGLSEHAMFGSFAYRHQHEGRDVVFFGTGTVIVACLAWLGNPPHISRSISRGSRHG